jgi:hypothetical protein
MSVETELTGFIQWIVAGVISIGGFLMRFMFGKVKAHEDKLEITVRKVDVLDEKVTSVHDQAEHLQHGIERIFNKLEDTNKSIVELKVAMARRRRTDGPANDV